MNKINIFSRLFFILLASASGYSIYCDTSAANASLDQLRSGLNGNSLDAQGNPKDPHTRLLKHELPGERLGVCFNYAISKALNLEGKIPQILPIPGAEDWYEMYHFTKDYCKETSAPEKGDLVVYYNDENCPIANHMGLVEDDGMVESKWGREPHVLIHPTFNTPTFYGKHVKYYKLTISPDEIIEDMKKKISHCSYTKRMHNQHNEALVYHAETNNLQAVWNLSHTSMCVTPEATNKDKQTILIIAAKNNNLELIKALKDYDADINKQDIYGKTALHLATENEYFSIIPTLLDYRNCDINITDNSGKTALEECYEFQQLTPIQYALKRCAKPTKIAEKDFWRTMNA